MHDDTLLDGFVRLLQDLRSLGELYLACEAFWEALKTTTGGQTFSNFKISAVQDLVDGDIQALAPKSSPRSFLPGPTISHELGVLLHTWDVRDLGKSRSHRHQWTTRC
jgi:hypothetical protein